MERVYAELEWDKSISRHRIIYYLFVLIQKIVISLKIEWNRTLLSVTINAMEKKNKKVKSVSH